MQAGVWLTLIAIDMPAIRGANWVSHLKSLIYCFCCRGSGSDAVTLTLTLVLFPPAPRRGKLMNDAW